MFFWNDKKKVNKLGQIRRNNTATKQKSPERLPWAMSLLAVFIATAPSYGQPSFWKEGTTLDVAPLLLEGPGEAPMHRR